MEFKERGLEVKDIDLGKRTAVIAYAVYNNIDRVKDISRRGMFTKTWKENFEDIAFYKNHDPNQAIGKPVRFWEDGEKAYMEGYLGTHTAGEDALKMMDEGIIKNSSFGYQVVKSTANKEKGIRELNEVKLFEVSVLTVMGANPKAKVEQVYKSYDPEMIAELKQHLDCMYSFVRNTRSSDEAIKQIMVDIEGLETILKQYDTAFTLQRATEPEASVQDDNNATLTMLALLNAKIN